jgi:hypothetical protein
MKIWEDGDLIIKINFYSGKERLVKVGHDDDFVEVYGGRVESFDIADGEQLIGCELHQYLDVDFRDDRENAYHFCGLRWIKMKVRF